MNLKKNNKKQQQNIFTHLHGKAYLQHETIVKNRKNGSK